MPPPFDARPKVAPVQYVFIALAVVGALVSGVFLATSFSGSNRALSEEALSQLSDSYEQAAEAAEDGSRTVGMSILTDPPMATVYVDFDSLGVTPLNPNALKAGTYFLSVSKVGYMTYDTLVTLRAGEHPLFWFTLEPWDAEGGGQVAQVRRTEGGEERPTTVLAPQPAAPAAGGVERSVQAEDDRPEPILPDAAGGEEDGERLAEAVSENVGTLVVLVRPWGAIYIDGAMHRSNSDVAYTVRLPVGDHHVRAVHPALGAVERTVRVSPESPERVIFNLTQRSSQGTSPVADGPEPSAGPPATADVPVAQGEGAESASNTGEPAVIAGQPIAVAEEPPVLIGGLEALQRRARYPEKAYTFGVEGRVFLQFVVDEAGRVQNPVVTRGLGMGCDEEALRVIRDARFQPGRVGGEAVPVQHALSIIFRRER